MSRLRRPLHLLVGLALLLSFLQLPSHRAPEANASTQAPGCHTFRETGKSACDRFLRYWLLNDGLPQQGYPISLQLEERSDIDGKLYTVQYFERSVFEYHPENARTPHDVLLSQLGRLRYNAKYSGNAPGQQPNTTPGSVAFSETGKRLGGRFLQYWQQNGGLAQQGFPISDEFMEKSDLDGKTYRVQYFERGVFEMHPENGPPNDVLLSQLGTFRYNSLYRGPAAKLEVSAKSPVPPADWTIAQVVDVIDGDTIDVNISGQVKRIRYIGVDTPETKDPRTPVQCFGQQASDANEAMVGATSVFLEKDISETDRYGRLLRYVYTPEAFVNAELVRRGYARAVTYPPDVRHEPTFRDLERAARDTKAGLWGPPCNGVVSQPTAVPPPQPPPSQRATATPRPPAPPSGGTGKVIISHIFYDGREARSEGDEYAAIKNTGSTAVNLEGYHLNAGDGGQDFYFPSFVLRPGAEVRVYTNRDIEGSFSFGRRSAIWNNSGDCGYLYDPNGAEVSKYCY
jgi:micrococcal nuclease